MRLALIYSGGTIGCAGVPLNPLPVNRFQELWGRHIASRLDDALAVDWQWLETALDSSDMTPADWVRLAGMVLTAQEEEAVILLHGTDTMAWTAAALALLLTLYDRDGTPVGRFDKPVAVTGSQRPLFEGAAVRAGTDALDNLLTAIEFCRSGKREVAIAFGGEVLPGARAMKMSTVADRAFDCPKGAAPCPGLPPARTSDLIAQLDRITPHFGQRAVVTLTPNPGAVAALRDQLEQITGGADRTVGAIYLNGYGIGNFPGSDALAPLLRSAHDAGILIVAGSQVPFGDVDPSTYGAGHWLGACGAIASADMATPAVHAKLYLAMAFGAANGWDMAAMERFHRTAVAGELRAAD